MRRWIYADKKNPDERRYLEEKRAGIAAWWSAFERNGPVIRKSFRRKARFDVEAFMEEHLLSVDRRICWEFGRDSDLCDYLTITPEMDRWLRPLVNEILADAPRMSGWVFLPHRPQDAAMVVDTVVGRAGVDVSNWRLSSAEVGEHGRIDVRFAVPGISPEDVDELHGAAVLAVECLLGEEIADETIGFVDVIAESGGAELSALAALVERISNEMAASRPDEPFHRLAATAEWTILKLHPDKADDYVEQRDLFVAKTCDLTLWRAQHSRFPFFGRRSSRFGETFCYVKLDGSERLDEEKFAGKAESEDAITEALEPGELGAFVGGGTGLRYSYIDLALRDAPSAIDRIRSVLQAGRVPRRSWIQFFDADMAAEWIGIYDDSPPPPLEEQ